MEDFEINIPDEAEVIAYIRENAAKKYGENFLQSLSDDDITYIIDIAYDYYEDKGALEVDVEPDDVSIDIDTEDLLNYVERELKKDGELKATREEIETIVLLESECLEQLGKFE